MQLRIDVYNDLWKKFISCFNNPLLKLLPISILLSLIKIKKEARKTLAVIAEIEVQKTIPTSPI